MHVHHGHDHDAPGEVADGVKLLTLIAVVTPPLAIAFAM